LNEAIDLYLEVHRWQVVHILEGLRPADNEEFAMAEEVAYVCYSFGVDRA